MQFIIWPTVTNPKWAKCSNLLVCLSHQIVGRTFFRHLADGVECEGWIILQENQTWWKTEKQNFIYFTLFSEWKAALIVSPHFFTNSRAKSNSSCKKEIQKAQKNQFTWSCHVLWKCGINTTGTNLQTW